MLPYSGVLPHQAEHPCWAECRCSAAPLELKGVPQALKDALQGLKVVPRELKVVPRELKDVPRELKDVPRGWVERPDLVEMLNSVGGY